MQEGTVAGTKLSAAPQSLLDAALDYHQTEIMKLGEMIQVLANRLQPVMRQYPQGSEDGTKEQVPEPVQSRITNTVTRGTQAVKMLQAQVSQLLEDLDV